MGVCVREEDLFVCRMEHNICQDVKTNRVFRTAENGRSGNPTAAAAAARGVTYFA